MDTPDRSTARDVSAEVFGAFFDSLRLAGADAEVVERLETLLRVDKTPSEKALKAAVFGEDKS
jgi:hypothetical protein